jgi:hypothetical protein
MTLHPCRPLLVGALAIGVAAGTTFATAGTAGAASSVDFVSLATGGAQADNESSGAIPSADGRFVVFTSHATNLSAADTNGSADVYVRDRIAGTTQLVSVGLGGNAVGGFAHDISADGRYVVFTSGAPDVVANDFNGYSDVFIRDLVLGTTEIVSVDSDEGPGQQSSFDASISKDGRYVAFASFASLADEDSSSSNQDVYVRDRVNGTTELVSVDRKGGEGTGQQPSISDNGRWVSFTSAGKGLVKNDKNKKYDVFVRDVSGNKTVRVSVGSKGEEAGKRSYESEIAGWGRFVVFTTAAKLVKQDDDKQVDVYVRDRRKGKTQLVSVTSSEQQAKGVVASPSISNDGRLVTFHAGPDLRKAGKVTNSLYLRDRGAGTTRPLNNRIGTSGSVISGNGAVVVFDAFRSDVKTPDVNSARDVFALVR